MVLLGIGGVATVVLTIRLGQIVRRLGFPSQTVTTVGDRPLKNDDRRSQSRLAFR